MKYLRPVKSSYITQKFGENKNNIYATLGWVGHNGIDFGVPSGTPFYWYGTDKGTLIEIGQDNLGGNYCSVLTEEDGKFYRHRFFHLQEVKAKVGQVLESGDFIGYTDNTGTATTGPHLHALDIKEVRKDEQGNWKTWNVSNGYGGSINPEGKYIDTFVLDYIGFLKKLIALYQQLIGLLK